MSKYLPTVSDTDLESIRVKEPTAFRITYANPLSKEVWGDVVFRKPTRAEVRRFKDNAKRGGDTSFIVDACLLRPDADTWARVTAQELSALPETCEDDLLKSAGILAENDLGKR